MDSGLFDYWSPAAFTEPPTAPAGLGPDAEKTITRTKSRCVH